jgi:WD40 repeat protein/serine/threonine protein kinase
MSAADTPGSQAGSGTWERLDHLVMEFEDAWEAGRRPRVEDFLPPAGPERSAALVELVHVDLERRLKAGEFVRVEAYLAAYPELADQASILLDLLRAEHALRRPREPRLGLAEYLRRFPQHAAALRQHLSAAPQDAVAFTPAVAAPAPADTHRPAAGTQVGDSKPLTVPPAPAAAQDKAPGLPAVPGYELMGELGRGGMGVVYQARQTALSRIVALKMILAGGHAGEEYLARFRTEAEAIARLQHPNIVQVFEVGEWRAGDGSPSMPFFSLEFCAGGSLDKKLAGTPLPPQEAARLVQTLAGAMEAAHQAGVVHRDLKPANILLSFSRSPPASAGGALAGDERLNEYVPKITDFGLAKKLDSSTGQTQSGAIIGTPSYMAPEQAGGHSKTVGPAADVYALGAILYECLTGRPPFKAATAMETMLQVVGEEPVRVRQLQPKVPLDLETIALKCLQKEPAQRYGSAQALADDLGRFLAGQPIVARPVNSWVRVSKWIKRRPAAAALLGVTVLMVLALVGGGVSLFYSGRLHDALGETQRQRDIAEQERETAQELRKEADQQRDRAEQLVYARQIALAQVAWQEGRVRQARELLDACRGDLRGWEHDYLDTLFNANQQTFRGHTHSVTSVCFSPDGRHLASGSWDQTVKLWHAVKGEVVRTLQGHADTVWSVCFSPDGKRLASASADRTVKLWNPATGEVVLTLQGHAATVWSVCFSPDGKRLASASRDWTVKLWDAETGQEVLTLQGHIGEVTSVCFSPDGTRLASASTDGTVKVWDVVKGQALLTLKGGGSVCFSPDGKRLASVGADKTVKVWDAATGHELFALKGHTGFIFSVCFSPDGRCLASGDSDQKIKVWDAATGQEVLSLQGHTDKVWSVCFSPDSKHLASASFDQTVKVWNAAKGQDARTFRGNTRSVYSICFSPDGKRLATGSGGSDQQLRALPGEVKLWDAATGQELLSFKAPTGSIHGVCFSPDGRRLATGSRGSDQQGRDLPGEVKVWDAATGVERLSLQGHTNGVISLCFSPDGQRLASGSGDTTVKVWNAATGQEVRTLRGHTGIVTSVCFSPDGQRLASASIDGTVRVWEAATGQEVRTLQGHTGWVLSVCFSPDGRRLASGSSDDTVKLWDAATGRELFALKGHTGRVAGVCFSPDGRRLASASWDQTVKLWDAATGLELLSLKGHTDSVWSVCFSPDGRRLASAGADRTVKVWDAAKGQRVLTAPSPLSQL